MRGWAKAAISIIVTGCVAAGLCFYAISGIAPRWVAASFDLTARTLTGKDPLSRCWRRQAEGKFVSYAFAASRHCYAFGPARQFKGVYIAEFEGERFLQNVGPSRRYVPRDEVWLSLDEETDVSRTPRIIAGPERSRIWLIDFIGRKTVRPGSYGHMGGSSSEVVVDRMLDAKLLSEFNGYMPPDVLSDGRQLR